MATYVIGDVQGCYDELQELLGVINFTPTQDNLWFAGDLINVGPKSLDTLRFVKSLGDKCLTVLGNHDLSLLKIAATKLNPQPDKTFTLDPVLNAPDLNELLTWLRTKPLVHYNKEFNVLLVHAGVLPTWDLPKILELAREVEAVIQGPHATAFYHQMYGDQPDTWQENLTGFARFRFIVNCFTRMRFCSPEGKLDLFSKGSPSSTPVGYMPWFKVPHHHPQDTKIIFGHWAALLGKTDNSNFIGLDTGCVWGNSLTALRLDDWQKFSVVAKKH